MTDATRASAPGRRFGGFFSSFRRPRIALCCVLLPLLSACGREDEEAAWIDSTLASLDLQRQAAQLIASPVALETPADYAAAAARRLSTLPGGAPGSFWITSARPDLFDSLRTSFAGRPLQPLFAADLPDPEAADSVAAAWQRRLDLVLPPNGYERADEQAGFFDREDRVGLAIRAFDEATADSMDDALWDASRLKGVSLPVLRRQMQEAPAAIALPARAVRLDPADTLPAFAASDLVRGVLRRDLGWEGLVIADLRGFPSETALRYGIQAIAAGADLLVTDLPVELMAGQITAAVQEGRLSAGRVEASVRRVLRMKFRQRDAGPADQRLPALAPARVAADLPPGLPLVPADSVGMSASDLAEIGDLLGEGLEDSVFTAATVVVARHGAIAYRTGAGMTSDSTAPDPDRTLFDLASLSKVVGTTTAAGILLDRGEIELDTPVSEYLDEFRGGDKSDVTVRQLLSHTSGLPAGIWLYGAADSEEGAYERLFRVALQREPGEAMEYSDLGMILMALVVERVSGMALDEFLAANVFVPLGMRWTTYLPPASLHDRIVPTAARSERSYPVQGVVHDGNAFRLNGVAGHAGLFSTAGDLAVFAQMMLNGGEYQGRRILSAEMVDTLVRIQQGAGTRALGWDTPADRSSSGRYFSSHSFGHTGFTGTSIWIDPLRDLFVVLLTNRTYPDADSGEMFDVRRAVHEAAVLAIDDIDVSRRPGSR